MNDPVLSLGRCKYHVILWLLVPWEANSERSDWLCVLIFWVRAGCQFGHYCWLFVWLAGSPEAPPGRDEVDLEQIPGMAGAAGEPSFTSAPSSVSLGRALHMVGQHLAIRASYFSSFTVNMCPFESYDLDHEHHFELWSYQNDVERQPKKAAFRSPFQLGC